jgi:hypothetical protein
MQQLLLVVVLHTGCMCLPDTTEAQPSTSSSSSSSTSQELSRLVT